MFIKQNIGIVSLGLIGGSLLKALSGKAENICAVTRNPETIKKAKQYTNNISNDYKTLKNCDIVFVCSPMSETLRVLDELESILPSSAIVADVCSLKEFVTQKKRPYVFVGTHPMAGTENSGFDASFSELFKQAVWVLTPRYDLYENKGIDELLNIINILEAKPIFMDPSRHDSAAALISHMPMLVSQALMKAAMDNDDAIKMASSGFRDMTRLAMSNRTMANDMISMNRENIFDAFALLTKHLENLLEDGYFEKLEPICSFRRKMYDAEGKNISN